jgi:flavin reductase (DIM6/NTAB) family NADH-FMN oxidoreductase RutF
MSDPLGTRTRTHDAEWGEGPWNATAFRETLAHFCSGITIISSLSRGVPVGLTCQSFFSVSLEPPLVAFCVGKKSTTFPTILEVGSCVINVLSESQRELSDNFSRTQSDKWASVSWDGSTHHGLPVLNDALAWFECDIRDSIDAGDHVLVVARVLDFHRRPEARPLLYFQSTYAKLHADYPSTT